jgi:hypothetical protein
MAANMYFDYISKVLFMILTSKLDFFYDTIIYNAYLSVSPQVYVILRRQHSDHQ